MGFDNIIAVSGQTYTRKVDYYILTLLAGIAQSAYKMAGDIRKDREKSAEIFDEISFFYEKGAEIVCADEVLLQKYLAAAEKQIRIFAPTMAKRR